MTRISRVLFPENDSPQKSRIQNTTYDSLANLSHAPSSPTTMGNNIKTSEKSTDHRSKRMLNNCGVDIGESRSRGQSKDARRDRRRNLNEARSSRRVTMEGSVLSTLASLENTKQETKMKKTGRRSASRRGRRSSKGKKNVSAKSETGLADNRVASRCSRYSTSVFECLPTQDEPELSSSVISPHLLHKSVQIKQASPAIASPPTDITRIVHLASPCVYDGDDDCILSPSVAPKALKRIDLKDTPLIVNTNEVTESREGFICREHEYNAGNIFQSPSIAPRETKRAINQLTPALNEADDADNFGIPSPSKMEKIPDGAPTSGLRSNKSVGGMRSKSELPPTFVEALVESKQPNKEIGAKPIGDNRLSSNEMQMHADREGDIESRRFTSVTVQNCSKSLLDRDVSDISEKRNELTSEQSNEERMEKLCIGLEKEYSADAGLVHSSERAFVQASKSISPRPRRSIRYSRPVDRLVATFKRKRKRKKEKITESPTQIPGKEENRPEELDASCNEKNISLAPNPALELSPVKQCEAKPRRSARNSLPTQRFTILSFRKKNKKAKSPIVNEDERVHFKGHCKENDEVEKIKPDDIVDGYRKGKKSLHESKAANESESEDDIFNSTPTASRHPTKLSIRANTHVSVVDKLKPSNCVKTKPKKNTGSTKWTKALLDSLQKSHSTADPISLRFWQDVAVMVDGKSAQECRDKWFSLTVSPTVHRRKKILQEESSYDGDDDEDDIFNSTPGKLVRAGKVNTSLTQGQKGSYRAKSFKRLSDLFSSPLLNRRKKVQSPSQNKSPSFFRPNYKTYVKEVRNGLDDKFKVSKSKITSITSNHKQLTASIEEGDLHLGGALSPGGTLYIKEPDADELENMYVADSDVDSIERM